MSTTHKIEEHAVGYDLGHSAIKVATKGGTRIIPTTACPAMEISDEAERRRAATETFEGTDGRMYFVGETALIQGSAVGPVGISDRWISSPEYGALLRAADAAARALHPAKPQLVVMGVPASHFAAQAKDLAKLGQSILGCDVRVLPQSYAAYMAYKLDRDGVPRSAVLGQSNFGVIEVGYYTTDFSLIQRDRPVERANISCGGVRLAIENLQRLLQADHGISATYTDCDDAIRTGHIRHFGSDVDVSNEARRACEPVVAEIQHAANRVLESAAARCDAILVAGGGAPIIAPRIRERWKNAIALDAPRFAVAEGMRRFGEMSLLTRRMGK